MSHSAAETPKKPIRTGDQSDSHDEEVVLEGFDCGPASEQSRFIRLFAGVDSDSSRIINVQKY